MIPFFAFDKLLNIVEYRLNELFFEDDTFHFSGFFLFGNSPITSIVFINGNGAFLLFSICQVKDMLNKFFYFVKCLSIDLKLFQILYLSALCCAQCSSPVYYQSKFRLIELYVVFSFIEPIINF